MSKLRDSHQAAAAATPAAQPFAAFIGVDWADAQHDVSLRAADTLVCERSVVAHTPQALHAWMSSLRERFGGRPLALAVEQSRGPLLYALLRYEFLTLFPVPPLKLAEYRKALGSAAGAKDDPVDADLIRDLLERHPERLRAWQPDDGQTRELALLVEGRRRLVDLRTQLTNQLGQQLKQHFPQALGWFQDSLHSRATGALLRKWPSLAALQAARPADIRRLLKANGARGGERLETFLAELPQAQPLTTDAAVLSAGSMAVQALASQLRPLGDSIAAYDRKIAAVFELHPDAHLFSDLPGAGAALAPRLLAAFGSNRQRFASAAELQSYSGIAPITRRSGKRCTVQRRLACPAFLRQTFHEFAGWSVRYCRWAGLYYERARATGQKHQAAVRALAFKWIRVLFACWRDRRPYDESRYEARLLHRDPQKWEALRPTAANS
jgi:transposase